MCGYRGAQTKASGMEGRPILTFGKILGVGSVWPVEGTDPYFALNYPKIQ